MRRPSITKKDDNLKIASDSISRIDGIQSEETRETPL